MPSVSAFTKKLKKNLEERQKDRDRLKELSDDLTSNLSDDNPDKQEVKQPCDDITSRWDDLANRLEEAEPKLENLRDVAKDHESDYSALTDWLGPMNDKVAAMATVPSDLDSIQEQLKAVEVSLCVCVCVYVCVCVCQPVKLEYVCTYTHTPCIPN